MPYVAFPSEDTVHVVIPGKQPPQTLVNYNTINFVINIATLHCYISRSPLTKFFQTRIRRSLK